VKGEEEKQANHVRYQLPALKGKNIEKLEREESRETESDQEEPIRRKNKEQGKRNGL